MTRAEQIRVFDETVAVLEAEIDKLTGPKPGFSKKQAGDIKAGIQDGCREMLKTLISRGHIIITG